MKRLFLVVTIFLVIFLSACDSGEVHIVEHEPVVEGDVEVENTDNELKVEPTIIILGGLYIHPEINLMVSEFNRNNTDYQIEVRDYMLDIIDEQAALTNLNIDMISGVGPDIIFGFAVSHLENTEFLADMNPFLDNDTELSREEFLPNILKAMENDNDELQLISNSFSVEIYLMTEETLSNLGEITYENIVSFLAQPGNRFFGPEWMMRE